MHRSGDTRDEMQQQRETPRGSIMCGDVRPVAEDVLVHRVFAERSAHRQDVGVDDAEGFMSYRALDRLSNAAARRLTQSAKLRRGAPATGDREKLWTIVVDVEPMRGSWIFYIGRRGGPPSYRPGCCLLRCRRGWTFRRRRAWTSPAGFATRRRQARSRVRSRGLAVRRQQGQIHPPGTRTLNRIIIRL